ncbi:MAG: cobalt ECF transporter T component CbiQ [Desulfovibrionaceae bacterium]
MSAIAEPFAQGNSILHRRDPRIKILAALAFSLPAALVQDIRSGAACLLLGTLLALSARLPLEPILKRLGVVGLFVGFLWIFIPFSLPGTTLFHFGPLSASEEGIKLCLLLTCKSFGIVLGLTALLATMSVNSLGQAMQQLGVPDKLCLLLLFTWRYIEVIRREYLRQHRAVKARGFRPRTSMHTYRTYAWLVGMLLVRSWDRAERVHQAMRCRGFSGRFHSLATVQRNTLDWLLLILTALAGSLLLVLDHLPLT